MVYALTGVRKTVFSRKSPACTCRKGWPVVAEEKDLSSKGTLN